MSGAADDSVKRDKVGGVDLVCECDEVAGEVADATGMALSFCLLAGDRDVRARRVHVDCRGSPGSQQLMVDRTHATADVEDRLPVDTPAPSASISARVVPTAPC